MFKHHKIKKSFDIEELVTVNEMAKKTDGKETTYQQIKRKKACSAMRALAESPINVNDDDTDEQTLLDKGYEVDQIVGVTTMDNVGLLICYLIRYKGGQMELVPNKLAHQHCPQMVIEFLESRLIFQDRSSPINETVDEVDSDEEMRTETSDNVAKKNPDEEEQTLYVFDELSKYLNLNDFENMIRSDSDDGGDDNPDDGQASDKSSQINKLTVEEDIPVMDSISDFEDDDDEPLLMATELDADSELQEINHTLSLPQAEQHSSHDTMIEDRPGSSAVDHWTDLSQIPESELSDTAESSSQQDVSLINESHQYSYEI